MRDPGRRRFRVSPAAAGPAGTADRPTLDEPWACVLRVGGALAPRWAARLGGLRIAPAGGGAGAAGEALTELRGALPDQAMVQEVLHTLHTLGFALHSLTCTPRRRPAGGGAVDGPAAG